MERSEQLNELGKALSAAQAVIKGAAKDTKNDFFKAKYADLSSVWDACRESLTANGLSVSQFCLPSDPGTLALTTMLLHSSGQFISGTMTMPLGKADPQGFGSALTYARRYGLAAIVGVCPDDDDAEGAMSRSENRQPVSEARAAAGNGAGKGVWQGPGQCPSCNCPAGKPHSTSCGQSTRPPVEALNEDRTVAAMSR